MSKFALKRTAIDIERTEIELGLDRGNQMLASVLPHERHDPPKHVHGMKILAKAYIT